MKKRNLIAIIMIILGVALIATALGIVYNSYPPNRANDIDNTIAVYFDNNSGGTFETIMNIVTWLGKPIVFIGLLLLLYYAWDKKKAYRAILVTVASTAVNYSTKAGLKLDRPPETIWSEKIDAEDIISYGLPSGHTQMSTTFWGLLGIQIVKWGMLIFAIALPLLIGFSRIYLRVHWFTDIIMGLGIGLLILALYVFLEKPLTTYFEKQATFVKILYVLLLMIVFAVPIVLLHYDPVFLQYDINGDNFKQMISTLKLIILFTTASLCYVVENKLIDFENKKDKWWHVILRILIGIVVVALIYGYTMVFDFITVDYIIEAIVDLVVYALLGPILILFIPWVIKKLKI